MAETGSEDLTTEQILSSIREILLDGEKKTQPKKEEVIEDILELTPAMVIGRAKEDLVSKSEIKVIAVPKSNFSSEEVARNIIKSFAKKFSNLDENAKKDYLSQQENKEDNLLRASISTAVEDWILKNIKADFELQKTVKEEVAKQVNVWFDANFVNLVNLSIKQELERVMVKVNEIQ